MARYIDADALSRRVKTHTNPYGKPTLDYESGVKVLRMIEQEPTADVAPKSEVIDEFAQMLKEEMNYLSRMEYHCDPYFLVSKAFVDKIAKQMKGGE